jgi:hypothetical protein
MIALCSTHHVQAELNTWTKRQLREFKANAAKSREVVKGRFDWMRYRLLGIAGGNGVYDVSVLFYCSKQPIIWFTRDSNGYLRVNLRKPRNDTEADPLMEDNDWLVGPDVGDIDCPPGGNLLAVRYPNGDVLRVEFRDLATNQDACQRYPALSESLNELDYPLVAVEFRVRIRSLEIDIGPSRMILPRANTKSC